MFLNRPRFVDWDYHPTGILTLEFEQVYVYPGTSPRRSYRDTKNRLLENMAGDNPIEKSFSKLKIFLRKAAARTIDDLIQKTAEAIDQFKSSECLNYFIEAGYPST